VIAAPIDEITDRFGTVYSVTRTPMEDGNLVYHVFSGGVLVARASLLYFKCYIDDVLVYKEPKGHR
jgi:hypothetical protein